MPLCDALSVQLNITASWRQAGEIAVFFETWFRGCRRTEWRLEGVFPSRAVFNVAARHEPRCRTR